MTFTETVIACAIGVLVGSGVLSIAKGVAVILGLLLGLLIEWLTDLWDMMRYGPQRRRAAKARMAEAEAKVQRMREAKPKPHECGKLCEGVCPEWWKR